MTINRNVPEKEILKELSERFKQHRLSLDISQKEICEKTGLSKTTIHRFENGSDISLLNMIKLLSAVDLTEKIDLLIFDFRKSPMFYVDNNENKKRVKKSKIKDENVPWKWGEDYD